MKSFNISSNDAGQRLDKFITKAVPLLPKALMYKSIRKKYIKVNKKRADISVKLCEGDVVDMYISDEFFQSAEKNYDFMKASKSINIIYEDENILILDKPAGLLAHPDNYEYNDTLITRIKRYLYEKGDYLPDIENSFAPALVNRIDRNTGGIVIAAKNSEALRILNLKMKNRELKKYYLCIVSGKMKNKTDTIVGFLSKNESKNVVSISKNARGGTKQIVTKYTVIAEKNDMSLLEVELLTGRTHQIRAHMASIGHPLLGDRKYGRKSVNEKSGFKNQALYSYKLIFDFQSDGGILEYLNEKTFEAQNVSFMRLFQE